MFILFRFPGSRAAYNEPPITKGTDPGKGQSLAIGRGVIGFQRWRRPAMGAWPQSIAIRLTQGYANCQVQYAINFARIFVKITLKQ